MTAVYLSASLQAAQELDEVAHPEVCHVSAQVMLAAVHPWDTHGAKAAGLQTAYINRDGAAYPPYFLPPDADVPSLVALAELLQGQA